MTIQELESLLVAHKVKIDGWRGGAGHFRDLYVGTGAPLPTLLNVAEELRKHWTNATLERVNVPDHTDYGKHYLLIHSFWWN